MKSVSRWPRHEHGRKQSEAFTFRTIYFVGKLEIIGCLVRISINAQSYNLKAKEKSEGRSFFGYMKSYYLGTREVMAGSMSYNSGHSLWLFTKRSIISRSYEGNLGAKSCDNV